MLRFHKNACGNPWTGVQTLASFSGSCLRHQSWSALTSPANAQALVLMHRISWQKPRQFHHSREVSFRYLLTNTSHGQNLSSKPGDLPQTLEPIFTKLKKNDIWTKKNHSRQTKSHTHASKKSRVARMPSCISVYIVLLNQTGSCAKRIVLQMKLQSPTSCNASSPGPSWSAEDLALPKEPPNLSPFGLKLRSETSIH